MNRSPAHPLKSTLRAISKNVDRAMSVENPVFRNEVIAECHEWQDKSREWAEHTVVVRQNYSQLLLDVYSSAAASVFSTSVPDYRKMWLSPTGKRILDVQRLNQTARSTRVFIFDGRSDVTDEDRKLFDEHRAAGVEIRLYFDSEDQTFMFPGDLGRDWTIVDDGRAIGVTRSVSDYFEARWYFQSKDRIGKFLDYRRKLMAVSISFESFARG